MGKNGRGTLAAVFSEELEAKPFLEHVRSSLRDGKNVMIIKELLQTFYGIVLVQYTRRIDYQWVWKEPYLPLDYLNSLSILKVDQSGDCLPLKIFEDFQEWNFSDNAS